MADLQSARSRAGNFSIDEDRARRDAEARMRAARNFARYSQSAKRIGNQLGSAATAIGGAASSFMEAGSDTLPFDVWDRGKSAVKAGISGLQGGDMRAAYDREYAAEKAWDEQDQIRHPYARMAGKAAGIVGQLLLPVGVVGAAGTRIAQAAPLLARERAILTAAGGVVGGASQAASDVIDGRLSSGKSYAASTLGGMVGARSGIAGVPAGRAAALDGFTTSVADDALNGRIPDGQRALQAAANGRVLTLPADMAVQKSLNSQPRKAKEHMGELVSRARTAARGDRTQSTVKKREYLAGGGYTYPDQRTVSGQLVESKFGNWARLSKAQRRAAEEFGSGYRVDHVRPEDFGTIAAVPGGYLGAESSRADAARRSRFDQW